MSSPLRWRPRQGLILALTIALGPLASPRLAYSQPAADPLSRAKRLYAEGQQLFVAKQYAEAAEKFEAAYAFDPNPVLLFNLARATEESGDYKKAIQWYEAYLARYKDDKDADAVRHRIHLLSKLAVQSEGGRLVIEGLPADAALRVNGLPAPAPNADGQWQLQPGSYTVEALSPDGGPRWQAQAQIKGGAVTRLIYIAPEAPAPISAPPWWQTNTAIAGWSLAGLGTASLILASVFEARQDSAESDLNQLRADLLAGEGTSSHLAEINAARRDAQDQDDWSNVMWLTGGLCLAGATGLLVWSWLDDEEGADSPSTRLKVSPTGLLLEGHF